MKTNAMGRLRRILLSTALLGFVLGAHEAAAVPCTSGGNLDITAASDSLTLTPTPRAVFNFGEHVIVSATADFEIASYQWTIGGPVIKDYNENLGTKESPTPTTPFTWSTTNLAASDLTQPTVGFYWVPLLSQREPNNGPYSRNVILRVNKVGGGSCQVTVPFQVSRDMTDVDRQPEDFYTSNHRAPTSTNPTFGKVIDEHIFWHMTIHDLSSYPQWTRFLAWHSQFLARYEAWRNLFGYRRVDAWYPGMPLPTGPSYDVDPALRLPYDPDANHMPTYYTLAGGTATEGTKKKLADYPTLDTFNYSFQLTYHSQVHCNVGSRTGASSATSGVGYGSMCKHSSPKDPVFWRWHTFVDLLYRNYCQLRPGMCPVPPAFDGAAQLWMADNTTDNGSEPSPSPYLTSIDVWNRYDKVTTAACVHPTDSYGNQVSTGGVVRRCGTNLDHQNPIAGVTNYLYGRLRNNLPGNTTAVYYAEVAVYYALNSSSLTFPTDFTMIPDSRGFITLNTQPGVITSIGPVPWTPPQPPPGDSYTLYLRVLSVQGQNPTEGAGIDADVANNNNVTRRNVTITAPGP